jgi:hypothetical protein
MSDITREEFLASVEYDEQAGSLLWRDGWLDANIDQAEEIDGEIAAHWIVEACQQASRTCETCKWYDGSEHTSLCWWHDSYVEPSDFCSKHERKEAADA